VRDDRRDRLNTASLLVPIAPGCCMWPGVCSGEAWGNRRYKLGTTLALAPIVPRRRTNVVMRRNDTPAPTRSPTKAQAGANALDA
jgi:hypothetical protein